MSDPEVLTAAGLGLVFLLGLRHGLDPDHVAIIDNMTFQAADQRPPLAPWVGALFAVGHSLSVAAVALAVAAFSARLMWPQWASEAMEWVVIALLFLVGCLNLRALLRSAVYTPTGWRSRLVPARFRESSSPLGILITGVAFGLVFDTATQAAAWGAAASAGAGLLGAALVSAVFAAGMILTDTADSRIVAGLLRRGGGAAAGVRRYRRGVGWVIVALSFGMAAYALLMKVTAASDPPDMLITALGAGMSLIVVLVLLFEPFGRRLAAPSQNT